MIGDVRLVAIAVCCFAAVAVLGAFLAQRPLTRLDLASIGLRGHGTPVAIVFTRSGYWPALIGIWVLAAAAELFLRGGVAFAIVFGGTQLLSQAASDFTKELFKRIRPDDWLYHKELGFSYPSGHATTAIVFYGGLLLFIGNLALPQAVQLAAGVLLTLWMAGIAWSRMALAAHYGTDVLGGLLFGAGWLFLMMLVLRHLPVAHISA